MKHGFQNKTLLTLTVDGQDDVLQEPLVFRRCFGVMVRAPIGSTTDGLSTPKIVRMLPGYDATGDDWFSGVLHDAAYRNFLEIKNSTDDWVRMEFSQLESDLLILEAMTTQGVGFIRRHIIYFALRLGGCFAFREDRRLTK